MWMAEQGCGATIEAVWKKDIKATACNRVIKKIQNCGEALSKWSEISFGSVRCELKEKRKLLSKAELVASRGGDVDRVRRLEHEINVLLDRESQCGPNGLKYSGLEMVIEILGIFVAKHLNGDGEITLRDYIIERVDGALIRVVWWTQWWIFIKIYLPPQIRPTLRQFWSKSHM